MSASTWVTRQSSLLTNELHGILYGISTKDAGEETFGEDTFVLGILQDRFSGWVLWVRRQMEVLRSCSGSPHPLVVLRIWLILIIAVKQHQFLGLWRITAKSNTEARDKIFYCPSDRPDNMVQLLAFVVPMALMSRSTQSIHLCFGLPLFLLPGGTISRVFLPTYSRSRLPTWPNHLSLAFLHLSVMFSTFSFFLMSSFLTWSLSVWPHAHLHIFISVTSSFFTWELVTGTVSIPYSIAGWTIVLSIFPLTCDGTLLSHRTPESSSSCSIHTDSSCLFL